MRPLHELLNQIRWDPRFDPGRFRVRWLERNGHVREEPLPAFLARKDVPQHRARSVSFDDEVVWDRDTGVDDIDAWAQRATEGSALASAAFWNVLEDPLGERAADLALAIATLPADVVGLVEVTAPVERAVRALCPDRPLLVHGSVALLGPAGATCRAHRLPLPGRDGLLGRVGDVDIAVAHLTSDVRGDRTKRRDEQLEALTAALPRHGRLLVLLDANTDAPLPALEALGLVDTGRAAGPTFDPVRNPRAHSKNPAPRRLDRVFARGFSAAHARVLDDLDTSDHWPLVVGLGEAPKSASWGRSHRTAVALVPVDETARTLDAFRSGRDEAFDRWPPHVNLRFPFVDEAHLEEATVALARALVFVEPFEVALDGTGVFSHARGRYTVWARPIADALEALQDAVDDVAPHLREERTHHLTLASGTGAPPDLALPRLVFEARSVAVLRRGPERYEIEEDLPLGRARLEVAVRETGLVGESDGWRRALEAVRAALPGTCEAVGSSALQVRLVDSDLDVAWEPPPDLEDPLAFAVERLGGARVDAVHAPRVKLHLEGIDVDVLLGAEDARAAVRRGAQFTGAQRAALLALRVWARRRGLVGADAPASLAWLSFVDAHPEATRAEEIVRAVWRSLGASFSLEAFSGTAFRGVSPRGVDALRREATRAHRLVDGCGDDDAPWRAVLSGARLAG